MLGEKGCWAIAPPMHKTDPSGHVELCDCSQVLAVTPDPTTKTPTQMTDNHRKLLKKSPHESSEQQLKPLTNIQVTFYFIFYLPFGISLLMFVFLTSEIYKSRKTGICTLKVQNKGHRRYT
ncbi:hypothetical protein HJG60_011510 [Phyllostomus discolor]|uniref:Uncharacterized protein n=1 Tax=Phyllostomus discolor TaxID=89673 RepID=A0A833ZVC9_9CHIR|nr:hypothetical protein HJG60_011510 [Phyllostomus discolor]